MMRGPKGAAVSLRLADGCIETEMKQSTLPSEKWKILGWPLIRGPVSLVYSMVFGYKCMMESAEKATQGILESGEAEAESKLDKWLEAHFGPKLMAVITAIGTVLGLALAVGLFLVLPTYAFKGINYLAQDGLANWKALIEGGIRIVIFVGYMFAMSLIPDIRRVFQYHGAEHKSIFCYEFGLPLTVENVRAQKRFHPRCGTSFLFVMLLLGLIVSAVLLKLFPDLKDHNILWIAIKVLQFPLIMAFGYEFIRFAGRHLKNPLVRAISFPGLAMQRITTKEPDDDIIEVGIEALKAALGKPFEPRIPGPTAAGPLKEEDPPVDDPPSDTDSAQPPAAE
jgi:uncharacterized protein YqhQ